MGKSPGKWIKTVLFGRKASRSNSSRRAVPKAANEKEASATSRAPAADLTVDPALTSHPAHGIAVRNVEHSEGVPSNLPRDGVTIVSGNQVPDDKGISLSNESNDADRIKHEQAATKTQAAFRGYLARRAFRALKGIIRLQALVRGHLVRRQAIATLRCMQGIVKLQALVRGRIVRHSDTGLELYKKCSFTKPLDAKCFEPIGENASTQTKKLFANAFVCKVLASSTTSMPLRLQYGTGDPNSAWNWLERWTSSFFWRPLSQPKKIVNSKSQTKQGNFQTVETESGRPKRSVRRVFTANVDNGSTHSTSESEKPKRSLRKSSSPPVDSMQEHPQSELEKVKRNLRKVSSSTAEASERVEVETEKPKRILKKISSSPAPDISNHGTSDSVEKNTTMALPKPPEVIVSKQREVVEVETERPKRIPKKISSSLVPDISDHATSDSVEKNTEVLVSKQPEVETITEPLAVEGLADVLENDNSGVELLPFENSGNEENVPAINGDLISKDENQKSGRRRASFAGKPEYPENGVQNSPTLPSYMAATESAKAKLRAQGSPRFGQEGVEKNGITRRLSLPSSTNGKVNSQSPRTQRPTQASAKAGIRIDKSLLSSRDANEKVIQAEWRR